MIQVATFFVSVSLTQIPTCRTASARVEDVVEAKVRELKGTELCQFRLYEHIHDLDRDGQDDLLMVFSVDGTNGSANASRLKVDVGDGRSVVLTTAERIEWYNLKCSFCGRLWHDVRRIIVGRDQSVGICDLCVPKITELMNDVAQR